MPSFTDQMGRSFVLEHLPVRIISLVPSQTELLYALGLDTFVPPDAQVNARVVGITKFCVHPAAWFHEKSRIGGTKDINLEKIDALQPDLIIANKEENDRAQVESLAARYPVWVSDIKTLGDALEMIRAVGELVGRPTQAIELAEKIQKEFDDLAAMQKPAGTPGAPTRSARTAYLIWRKPWMAAGGGTFIDDMLKSCGLVNIFGDQERYPVIDPAALHAAGCDLILLSSEPYPFRKKHLDEVRALVPGATVRLADGELFSWYGSRLLRAPAYFRDLIRELSFPGETL